MLDYRLLGALAAVIDQGGFERAAQVLHLTQSAVSQRIRQLEERHGQVLLVRAQPPQPTDAGRLLLSHFRQVCLLEQELPAALRIEPSETPLTLALGINADSLSTWFWQAGELLLQQQAVLFDLRVDDQDVTLQLLKKGEVAGCVSAIATPLQGCRCVYLGTMIYRLLARPDFAARWFADGLSAASVTQAPAAIFGRHDALQFRLLHQDLGQNLPVIPTHSVPSPEAFAEVIRRGLAYGALPDQQSEGWRAAGELMEVSASREAVRLYWHCWNIASDVLAQLEKCLRQVTRQVLWQEEL